MTAGRWDSAPLASWLARVAAFVFVLCVVAFRRGVIGGLGGLLRLDL